MKYVCLGYCDENTWEAMVESDQNALVDECFGYDARVATTLRYRSRKVIITDGPYAETKEHIGGTFLLRGHRSG